MLRSSFFQCSYPKEPGHPNKAQQRLTVPNGPLTALSLSLDRLSLPNAISSTAGALLGVIVAVYNM